MKYQFRPYAKMQPTEVTLAGKVYEKGEHPLYTEHKIIEVVDGDGEMHYAFEDELKSDEVEKQQKVYSEEEFKIMVYNMVEALAHANNMTFNGAILNELFNKFKNK